MATTNSASFTVSLPQPGISTRNLAELAVGFGGILAVLWLPAREQLIFGPIALLAPLALVLLERPSANELGLSWRAFVSSFWILPAAAGVSIVGVQLAQAAGTLHGLYNADFAHVGGYVLWTIYQQFLLQDYFMPRLARVLTTDAAIAVAAVLFAAAHLPNVPLTVATLVWGAASCALFRRYRSLYVLGIAQGLLGLCIAVCIPDAFIHHMRVGLGYWHYASVAPRLAASPHATAGR
ncbi:MAG TPA: CPBP family glutamic-type intramembrane protease [Candidatus Dormibacteraeota bacterium]|nr:CPBP family glutamic-type intramembrane protease [Candidatus Dormibacteraeota bacterium]